MYYMDLMFITKGMVGQMKKVLIIEDDEKLKKYIADYLKAYEYDVTALEDFDNVLEDVKKSQCDIVLLDINLPVFDGFYYLKLIRKDLNIPVIITSARSEEGEQIRGINMGADDYITKPFSMGILLAKINAVLRRSTKAEDNILVVKDSKLNLEGMYLKSGDTSIALSKNEFNLLKLFFEKFNKVVSREELLESIWDEDEFIDDNTLTVNITRLKKKIKDNNINLNIETKRGIGYVLN